MAEETQQEPQSTAPSGLSLVQDVPLVLQVQLGEAVMTIGDVLKCGKGSVIPLNQKAGDPFKIFLESRLLAEGEIVEAGESLGIKVTKVYKDGAEN
ncbi:FliM/FliN family flagellar motor switch protein [bacterium]|nr:FliM/FliN family flagellar motor switch protein [bacterium]